MLGWPNGCVAEAKIISDYGDLMNESERVEGGGGNGNLVWPGMWAANQESWMAN